MSTSERFSRSRLRNVAIGIAIVMAMLSANTVAADDHPVAASTLKLKRSASGKAKLIFVTKDPSLPFPEMAPDPFSVFIKLIATGVPEGIEMRLREPIEPFDGAPEFTSKGNAPKRSYRFKHKGAPSAPSVVKSLLWREGKGLKIVARDAWLSLTGESGAVALRISWGSGSVTRLCALFDGDAVRTDKAGSYRGSKAPAPAILDCSDEQLAAGQPASCGDGIVGSGEECDGYLSCDLAGDPESILHGDRADCVVPSAPAECSCCSNTHYQESALPCCQPSVVLGTGPPLGIGYCIPTSCEPPFECAPGDTCLPDQSCCGGEGSLCGDWIAGIARDCCGGLVCADAGLGLIFVCQQP
jgi:hypothetical protein